MCLFTNFCVFTCLFPKFCLFTFTTSLFTGSHDVDCTLENDEKGDVIFGLCCFNGCYNSCLKKTCMNITETRIEYELQMKCTEEIHEECNDKIVPECKEICPNADDQQCPISNMDQDCSGAVSDCWTPGKY